MSNASARNELARLAVIAMRERGLAPDFPPAALDQLSQIAHHTPVLEKGVADMRDRLWCSIDNDDSRDLDQLSLCAPQAGGGVTIWVAIADVDALVARGTPIDQHAQANTTSVYTAARIFPMLPEALSTDLTSLNADADRLAVVTKLQFAADGTLTRWGITRALVRNQAKLAYDSVAAWLEGQAPLPEAAARVPGMDEQLRVQDRVAQQLRALRQARGALEFQSFQPKAEMADGQVIAIRQQEQNRARQLIQELMVTTNSVAAQFLADQGRASLRRVVRSPERWTRIAEVAAEHGTALPPEPDPAALEQFLALERQRDPLRFPDLSLVIIKLMGRGEYAVELPGGQRLGHFGLAVRDYSHSTAPNRRFPDLITSRMLKAALADQGAPYSNEALAALAQHCTQQEDAANKVERQMRKSEAALWLGGRQGKWFDGIVTGASKGNTWVRIFNPPTEGKLSGAPALKVGATVRVQLASTDVERGHIDFRWKD